MHLLSAPLQTVWLQIKIENKLRAPNSSSHHFRKNAKKSKHSLIPEKRKIKNKSTSDFKNRADERVPAGSVSALMR